MSIRALETNSSPDPRQFERPAFLAAAAVAFVLCAIRIIYASPFAASWDAVDFALALDRFDLLAMQPHFPGYPYFVLPGMLIRPFASDAALSLSAVSAISWAIAVFPMFKLVRMTLPAWPAAFTVSAMQGAAYMWVIGAQPMSEGMASAALWWYLWSIYAARRSKSFSVRMAPALAFGLLMGVRLSYIPFGLGLLLPLIHEWRQNRRAGAVALAAFSVLFQLVWVVALAMTEGSLAGFAKLSSGFVSGHVT